MRLGAPLRPRLALWEAVPLAYLVLWAGKQAFELFGEHIRVFSALPGAWSGWEVVSYCLHTAAAEELLIVAIPVAVLTSLRVSLRYQVLVVFALRALIHTYYGWPAVVLPSDIRPLVGPGWDGVQPRRPAPAPRRTGHRRPTPGGATPARPPGRR